MRRLIIISTALVLSVATVVPIFQREALALSGSEFHADKIISDSVFFNGAGMQANDVQIFLNSKLPICDTNHARSGSPNDSGPPYTCLNGYRQDTWDIPADQYCKGFSGANKSAAQIIYDVGVSCGINQKVILVLLQKEQSLVTDTWPWTIQYTKATGYGCPDTALPINVDQNQNGCYDEFEGFFKQIYYGARQFKRYAIDTNSFRYKAYRTNSIQYHPDAACGASDIYIQNQATAGLYNYTPYQPNAAALANLYGTGDNCSAYGNRNFWRMFNDWFGSTEIEVPYAWMLTGSYAYTDSNRTIAYSSSPSLAIQPNSKTYMSISIRNIGYHTWSQSSTFLGTTGPQDRASSFVDATWRNNARIPMDQTAVAPGGTATFTFSLTAPGTTGAHFECFNVVAEGASWMAGPGICYAVDVVTSYEPNTQNIELSPGQVLTVGNYLLSAATRSMLAMQSDGNLVLYTDSKPRWDAKSGGTAANRLVMQTDGNLVLYDQANRVFWSSNTPGNINARAVMQSDGNFVVYSASNAPLWSSGTGSVPSLNLSVLRSLNNGALFPKQSLQTATRTRKLIMQEDGNLVLYSNNVPIWASYTQGNPGAVATVQSDGNLVVYSKNGRPLWASYSMNNPNSTLILQEDGNLVIYNTNNRPVWHTHTYGR